MTTNETLYDIAIIGGGGAGQMAMLRATLNHLKTIVFLGNKETSKRGRDTWVLEVDNIPGMFDKKKPIAKTTKEVIAFIENKEDLNPHLKTVKDAVVKIKKEEGYFLLEDSNQTYKARFVVLCTGTMDLQPHINGSIQPILPYANRGDVLYCIRCDGHKIDQHTLAVIGHGEDAGWIAIMLKERYNIPKAYVLSHGKPFKPSKEVQTLLNKYEIDVIEDEITEILGEARKEGLQGFQLGKKRVPVTRAVVSLGSIVYNDLAKQLHVELDSEEHVKTKWDGATNVEGFYAAGDLVSNKKKQVYTAWDLAVDAVDSIDEKIRYLKRNGAY